MVDTANPGLRYMKVYACLREQIVQGQYQPGQRLPGQHELAKELGVSLVTLRRALEMLAHDGYVILKHGQGTYIAMPDKKGQRVLVVDDDAHFRQFVSEVVSGEGHEVVAVGDGKSAIEEVQKGRFATIFLDLRMPGISGIETMRRMKALDPQAVIIIVTGFPQDLAIVDRNHAWPVTVIGKPCQASQVAEALRLGMRAYPSGRR